MPIITRNKATVFGLNKDLADLAQADIDEKAAREAADGDLTTLATTEKTSLVGAINEVQGVAQGAADGAAMKDQNLADLTDAAAARTNIDVLSSQEVSDLVNTAQLNMGSNFSVATIAERDALTDLDIGDRVFVADDGDTKWALYKPAAVDGTGVVTSWTKLSDQDSLENSINADSIKASYESNADTNAYTDADKAKVDLVSVTQAIDLDDAVLKAGLVQTIDATAPADNAPSAAAVKAYAESAAAAGGAIPTMETVVVTADQITLTYEPRGGVAGVMNFGTVRYMDANGSAWDAPLIATADPKVFTVSVDTAGQWEGFSVQAQYLYTPGA